MTRFMLFAILALSACGVDGPPERPSSTTPGVTISGEARIGVVSGQ